MKHMLGLGAVLFVLWLMLSGHYEPLFYAFGLLSTALCLWIARRMDVADREGVPLRLGLRTPMYWPWLIWQIAKSNMDVARRILDPRLPISPTTLRIATGQRTALSRVVFANSLTLTPGTVSMSIDDDTILVHALTEENARDLESGEMRRRVAAFEGTSA
ncbi:MAG TPA: Na+/H+ antiporter subunit E [Woeseiaceae bacterium]